MTTMTISNTDAICVATRKARQFKEVNRVKILMEELNWSEREAKRLDYFVHNIGGVPLEQTAVAAAWVANETFYVNDGVNDWIWADWNGEGAGDWTTEPDSNVIVRVKQ
jgi:hypothetical protein